MVSTVDELRTALELLPEPIETGIMVEVPAAALRARSLARHSAFFSLGTNDLTQYTLAADRGNDRVAPLADGLDPAVLRLVASTVAAGRPVGVCGELGGDPAAVPILVGLGVRELSVSPPLVPGIKERVRGLTISAAADLARRALELESAQAVRALVAEEGP
jgi:multiphosphoryl transfer protein